MDGRHASAEGALVLQAKHYHRSGFPGRDRRWSRNAETIDRLRPTRYILVTSAPLTPRNKDVLSEIMGRRCAHRGHIFGLGDLNALLRKNIQRSRRLITSLGARVPRCSKPS